MIELAGANLPTKAEILQIISDGAKCPRCQKNPAELGEIMGVPCVGQCKECVEIAWKEAKERQRVEDNSMGSSNVKSVWVHPSGALIPVNEKGNVVHSPNMNSFKQKKGKKPIDF
jgi:hypothetical protein